MAYTDIYYSIISDYFGISVTAAIIILLIISIWTLIWKGIALWKAAGKRQLVWFVILLVVNTVGILEILYIYVFSKMNSKSKEKPVVKKLVKKR